MVVKAYNERRTPDEKTARMEAVAYIIGDVQKATAQIVLYPRQHEHELANGKQVANRDESLDEGILEKKAEEP
jgi:hypothetical protein